MSIKKISNSDGSAKWEVRFYSNGRGSKRVAKRFDKKIEAEAFLRDYRTQQKEILADPSKAVSLHHRIFQDEARYWFESAKMKFSPSHIKRMEGAYNQILPMYGDVTLDKITPEFLTKFQRDEKDKGLENSTINRKVQIFTSILNHSAKHRRIPYNPCFGFSKLKEAPAEMLYWDKPEAIGFLKFAHEKYPVGHESRWIYVAYLAALNTGLRAGEIWGLKPMDLGDDGLKITIRRQYNRVTRQYGPTKGNKNRVVPCNKELHVELKNLIRSRQIKIDEPIFMNESRNPICHDNFVKRAFTNDIETWAQATESKVIRFHDLRHTATTLMIAAGIDIKTVKEICGHSDIQTTMNYVHMVAGSVENVAKTFSILMEKEVS